MALHFIYHPDYEPVQVNDEQYHEMLGKGWHDSPAKFPQKAVGLSESDVKEIVNSERVAPLQADKVTPKKGNKVSKEK